jgi:hypothetical protein
MSDTVCTPSKTMVVVAMDRTIATILSEEDRITMANINLHCRLPFP